MVESAQHATIFGVHLGDKLLFSHPTPPLHVCIVIALTVAVSATTTFMTVRQSAKRGLMQTNVDPDNPMAQSQKFMQYIVPFFSLTGLYWQYGLVLYWVTTNVWTLGQQYFMFRNWTTEDARPPVRGGRGDHRRRRGPRQASLQAQTGAKATGTRAGGARPGSAKASASAGTKPGTAAGAKTTAASAKNGTTSSRQDKPRAKRGHGRQRQDRCGRRSARAATPAAGLRPDRYAGPRGHHATPRPANGQNGSEKRSLLRLGRKPEPEPEPEVPAAKVVRQQPVRQARSKRSGKR